ncbi:MULTISPECIES: ABC transporter ATP-binding protein [Bacillaceae]|uniref:Peptide ABC transporter ATP-binding protein n=2 Tax=Bacillaceae TaxID=186817 RepID=A0A9D5DRJ3_9BACI|nr:MULTISPECIES: ABC transporter ATP-binding protein [Bacillaceae]KQL57388.1 peptide ABC transporter ATP-binding protein [Alkalicoccobacillus plakortidis]MBG9785270.1 peptide ABC transporter ATP-binding protein [Shouchella lehensis]TES46715.1 ABC transporter ATP-binding protein [Shouchella lehensis]
MSEDVLLSVENLQTHFFTENGAVPSVNGVSFSIKHGETVAIVGESGCGKSVTSLSIMGLVSSPGKIVGGSVRFNGQDLIGISDKQYRKLRGNDLSMIFQEPLTSLNPLFTIGNQLAEVILLHQNVSKEQAKEKGIDMLKKVGIPRAEKVYRSFPHSLSGGMRQRVMIAIALACSPKLLIADEPTTALDVTIQAQILGLMRDLVQENDTAIMLITHDLGVVAEMADTVIVMYAGQVVEEADVFTLFEKPAHPYTQGLLASTPKINELEETLTSIEGTVPTPESMPTGCRFSPRCPHAMERCITEAPPLFSAEAGQHVRCWLFSKEEAAIV